ncbi:MAG: hypothetical protein JNL89_15985 [Rhodanobacteraceae bacterium]|nr:hypothetical protein [Rhodanobacteraceae bacterium]
MATRLAARTLALSLAAHAGGAMAGDRAPLEEIRLTPDGDHWRASYTLAQPARELRFARVDRQGHRVLEWTSLDAGIELVQVDGVEVVRRKDGSEFTAVAFRMLPRYLALEKDYTPFSPFSDGGLLIHSGRFHACPGPCEAFEGASARIRVQPPEGAHVIVHGKVQPVADFVEDGDGTNIYVGTATPVETDEVVAVIDPAFPQMAREGLKTLFPRLMAYYRSELGALARKPMLFASREMDYPGGGYGFQGGALPDQVFMHLYGRNEAFEHADFGQRMDWFFAHEAAHLYQLPGSQATPDHAWIHEGGADAMAALALRELGRLSAAELATQLDDNVDACSAGLAGRPLDTSHEAGRFSNFYSCGKLLQMLIDADARRASGGRCDLWCVWRDFLARTKAGEPWSTDTFLVAAEQHVDAEIIAFTNDAVRKAMADPAPTFRARLRAAGLAEQAAENP